MNGLIRCLILIATLGVAGPARGDGFAKWALMTSPDVQATGLGDLLTAEVTRGTGLVWLERDAVAAIAKELELAQLAGAGGGAARLQLGRSLGADALLLVTGLPDADPPSVRVVMAECRSGARLDAREYPSSVPPKQLCELIARRVVELRARFPRGVERVVGLAPFRSRNLLHDYDALQTRYADLLAQTLSREPGLAVLAVDEALAISRENAAQGTEITRLVPLLVEGEFRMTGDVGGATGTVAEVNVRLTGETGTQDVASGPKPLAAVPGWLVSELATRVLAGSGDAQGVSVEAQAAALVGQAEAFAQIGDYDHATALRESAILLLGDAPEQRLRAMEDYHRILQERLQLPEAEYRCDSARLRAAAARRANAYVAGLEHYDYLIRHALIDAGRAIKLAERWTTCDLIHGMPYDVMKDSNGDYWRLGQEELERAEAAEESFMTQTYPLVRALPGGDASLPEPRRLSFLNQWAPPLLRAAQRRIDRTYCTKNDLAFFLRVVTQLVPDGLEVRNQWLPDPPPEVKDLRGPDAASPDDYSAFLSALAASTNRMVSIQGRYALFYGKWLGMRDKPDALARLLPEMERLHADFQDYCREASARGGDGGSHMLSRVGDLVGYVRREAARPTLAAVAQQPPPDRPTPARPPPKDDTGALRLTPLTNFTVRLPEGEPTRLNDETPFSFVRAWLRCGDGLDVLWGDGKVCFLTGDRELLAVVPECKVGVGGVTWDGAHVWIGLRDEGILKLDTAGRRVGLVGREQGLPPSNRGLMVHALGPGRLVAIGSFGDDERAWCARVDWTGPGAARVSVFHEATHMPRNDENETKTAFDAQLVFSPHWLHAYRAKGDKADPFLLVGRYAPSHAGRRYPLQLNLRTFEVSVMDCDLEAADFHDDASYFSRDGLILEGGDFSTSLRIPARLRGAGEAGWRKLPVVNPAPVNPRTDWLNSPDQVTRVGGSGYNRTIALADDGWIYVPGMWWYRIDPRTWTGQRLTSHWLPAPLRGDWRLWNSARFGLVGQTGGRFYQVRIDESAIPASGSAMDL